MARKPLRRLAKFGRRQSLQLPTPAPRPLKKWKENLNMLGWIGIPTLIVASLLLFVSKSKWLNGLDNQLARWQVTYKLSGSVVRQLRQMELEFHGSGNPITTPIQHTVAEIQRHHEDMASLMGVEARIQFLRDCNSKTQWQRETF